MQNPKVSIVIPVYNGSDYLAYAIDCALKQTYDNIEVIVVNDGSTDNGATERIALSYGERIRYFCKENGGVSSALNYGIQQMRGEYFSWLSHDDAYSPNKISDAIELLRKHSQLEKPCIAITGGYYIDANGDRIKDFNSLFKTEHLYSGLEVVDIMTQKGTLNGCCMLIPKRVFLEIALFDETLRYSQDSLMWYQIFLAGYSLISDNEPNVMYRLHPTQTSHTRRDLFEKDADYIADLLAPRIRTISTKKNNILYKYALHMAKNRCVRVVKTMQDHADGECKFTAWQKLNLRRRLIYGSMRGSIKKMYYRFILRVKV